MTPEKLFLILKYLVIGWLIMSAILGMVYLGLMWFVIELFDQFGLMML